MSDLTTTVLEGPFLLAAAIALAAGLVSFFSPCCLPLVPGYLSYMTGLTGSELEAQGQAGGTLTRRRRGYLLLASSLFVLGFSLPFVAAGAALGGVGSLLAVHQQTVDRVAGVLLGAAFGVGWTPCLGPTLGAVQTLAFTQATAGRGATLTLIYCLGLGMPFILGAVAFDRALRVFHLVRRHQRLVTRLGGAMLITVGVLMITGLWTDLLIQLRGTIAGFTTPL